MLRPKSPGNVGSVARAMKNTGYARLILADPMTYDDPEYFETEAGRMAWQAADVLNRRGTAPSLAAALAPFNWVLGTTASPHDMARVLSPRQAAAEISAKLAEDSSASVALLFGQEDIGLTRDDLALCHAVGSVPTASAYPSLNLAQAALLFLYELRLALLERGGPTAPTGLTSTSDVPGSLPAHGQLEAFYGRLEGALDAIGFFQGTGRAHIMRDLRTIFNRALISPRELAIFEGIIHQVVWAARRPR